jgi:hypothetical protein
MALRERYPICPLCNKPVKLSAARTNEDGQAVHEECYTSSLLQPQKPQEPTAA